MEIIIYCGVYTGALVRHADASLAYGGWPLPFHDLVPHSEQDWVQLTHRIMAFYSVYDYYDYLYSRC